MSQNLDFPIWTHSGESGPLHYNFTIQPKSAVPGSSWNVQVKVEAPSGWSLKKWTLVDKLSASGLTNNGITPSSLGNPWTFEMEYPGELPPFGPGPKIETIWETPDGPVSILLDPGLTLSTTEKHTGLVENPTTFPWPISLVLTLILLIGLVLIWIRKHPKNQIKRWSRTIRANQPTSESPWPVWETWLNNAAQSARSRLPDVPETRALLTVLDEARFGPPFNPALHQCMGIIFGDKPGTNLPK